MSERQGKICHVVDADGKCYEPVYRMTTMACKKHHARFRRTGSFQRTTMYDRWHPSPEAISRKKRNEERERLRRMAVDADLNYPCMCMHPKHEHLVARDRGKPINGVGCKHANCECKQYRPANKQFIDAEVKKILKVGFIMYCNDIATCTQCFEPVRIGKWHDPYVMRRALLHTRKECSALQSRYKVNAK